MTVTQKILNNVKCHNSFNEYLPLPRKASMEIGRKPELRPRKYIIKIKKLIKTFTAKLVRLFKETFRSNPWSKFLILN